MFHVWSPITIYCSTSHFHALFPVSMHYSVLRSPRFVPCYHVLFRTTPYFPYSKYVVALCIPHLFHVPFIIPCNHVSFRLCTNCSVLPRVVTFRHHTGSSGDYEHPGVSASSHAANVHRADRHGVHHHRGERESLSPLCGKFCPFTIVRITSPPLPPSIPQSRLRFNLKFGESG